MSDKIILASGSPRRKNMMKKHGIPVSILVPDVDESFPKGLDKENTAMFLALKKALAAEKLCGEGIIIAADTIVYKDGILGKPKDYEEAVRFLKKLRASKHQVVTGVAIINAGTFQKRIFYETTDVFFKNYDDSAIYEYIQTGEVWDKAGAYAIQGYGSRFIERIEGDYDNVVGLPFKKLCLEIEKEFGLSLQMRGTVNGIE